MSEDPEITIGEREWDVGLWRMVLVSGALHVVAIMLVVLIPHTFAHRPPKLVSYTVDLVAPEKVGGTNVIAGGKGRVEGAPLAAAPKEEPPKPPPKQEAPKAEEKPVVKEVAKAEPPKPEPKPKENEMTLADKAKKAEPPPAPTAAKPAPSPQEKAVASPAKGVPSPKVVAKAEPGKQAPQKSAAEAAKETEARARDDRIAAAIRRVEQQAGTRGAGMGKEAAEKPGGPISAGPGEGAGGMVKGVEYLLYYNQMINRIKQTWAWAGAVRSLEAAVRFSIAENGEVHDVRIAHPSGDPSYDASVQRAVKAVNPLPAPPEAYRKEFSDVELVFRPDDLKM